MRAIKSSVLVFLLALNGCVSHDRSPERNKRPIHAAISVPPSVVPQLRLSPDDMTTSVGSGELRVLVDNHGSPLGDERLKTLSTAVKLLTWPGKVEVVTSLRLQDVSERRENGFQIFDSASIVVLPKESLKDGTYALVVDAVPEGIEVLPGASIIRYLDHGVASRFRVESDPRISRIRRCGRADGGGKIVIDFSEDVEPSSLPFVYVSTGGDCQIRLPPDGSRPSKTLGVSCKRLDRSSNVQVSLGQVVGRAGIKAKVSSPVLFTADTFTVWNEACEVSTPSEF